MTRGLLLILFILIAPPILVWAFVSTLVRGIGRATVDAWLDVRNEMAAMREIWRNGGPIEGWPWSDLDD